VTGPTALHPDPVLLAGDPIAWRDHRDAEVTPDLKVLAGSHGRHDVVVVPGNHDHRKDARPVRAALGRDGNTVPDNEAMRGGLWTIGDSATCRPATRVRPRR